MKSLCLGLIISGLLGGLPFAQEKGPPILKLDKTFHHKQTDVILPARIAGYRITHITRYGDSEFDGDDISVRFVDGNAKIDVYFYNRGKKIEDDEKHKNIVSQVEETLGFIKHYAAKGQVYRDVETSEKTQMNGFGDGLTMIQSLMRYKQVNRSTGKFDQDKLESSVAATIYANYFIKIRHSFPIPDGDKELKSRCEKRENFRSTVCKLIADTQVRPDAIKALGKFRADPEDADANSVIMAYAEVSKLVHVAIRSELLPFLAKEKSQGASSLLVGYIAGNIEAQLENMDFQSHDLEGVTQMLKTYRTLKKTNAVATDPILDRWSKLSDGDLEKIIGELAKEE